MSVSFKKTGNIYLNDIHEGQYTYDMEIYKLEKDGSVWTRILHHGNINSNIFTMDNALDIQTENLYSRLNILENFRDVDGNFEFMALQPGTDNNIYRWKQSNNPTNTSVIADYVNIENGEGGLVRCSGNTYCARSTSTGNWWCAVGCYVVWSGGLPGFGQKVVKNTLDLYVRLNNNDNKFKIYSTDIECNEIIEN